MEDEKFDLLLVSERFRSALEQGDDVLIDYYLLAFREIMKLVFLCLQICCKVGFFSKAKNSNFPFVFFLKILSVDGLNLWFRLL